MVAEQVSTHITTLIEYCTFILTHRENYPTETPDIIHRIVSELFPPLPIAGSQIPSGLQVSTSTLSSRRIDLPVIPVVHI